MTIEEFCKATKLTLDQVNGSGLIDGNAILDIAQIPDDIQLTINGNFSAPNLLELPSGVTIKALGNISLDSCIAIHNSASMIAGGAIYMLGMSDCDKMFAARKGVRLRNSTPKHSLIQEVTRKTTSITSEYIRFERQLFKVIEQTNDTYTLEGLAGDLMYLHTDQLGNWSLATTESGSLENMPYLVADRRKSDYLELTPLSSMSREEIVKCYLTVTGACVDGTKQFDYEVLKPLGQESITIQQLSDLTVGYWGHDAFNDFFNIN